VLTLLVLGFGLRDRLIVWELAVDDLSILIVRCDRDGDCVRHQLRF